MDSSGQRGEWGRCERIQEAEGCRTGQLQVGLIGFDPRTEEAPQNEGKRICAQLRNARLNKTLFVGVYSFCHGVSFSFFQGWEPREFLLSVDQCLWLDVQVGSWYCIHIEKITPLVRRLLACTLLFTALHQLSMFHSNKGSKSLWIQALRLFFDHWSQAGLSWPGRGWSSERQASRHFHIWLKVFPYILFFQCHICYWLLPYNNIFLAFSPRAEWSRSAEMSKLKLQTEFIGQAFGCLHTRRGSQRRWFGGKGTEEGQAVVDSRNPGEGRIPWESWSTRSRASLSLSGSGECLATFPWHPCQRISSLNFIWVGEKNVWLAQSYVLCVYSCLMPT